MKNIFTCLSSFIILVSVISCEKEATINIPEVESKLVVTSFISPQDTLIRVKVTRTTPFFGTRSDTLSLGNFEVSNAAVTISDGVSTIELQYSPKDSLYIADANILLVKEGVTYFLKITTPDGLTCDAHCTIPLHNDSFKIKYEGYFIQLPLFVLSWNATPKGEQYFRCYLDQLFKSKYSNEYFYYKADIGLFSNTLEFKKINFTDSVRIFNVVSVHKVGDFSSRKLDAYFLCVDESYYKYHKFIQSQANKNDDPFQEPVLRYTNIKGGLGIFAGYNQVVITVEY